MGEALALAPCQIHYVDWEYGEGREPLGLGFGKLRKRFLAVEPVGQAIGLFPAGRALSHFFAVPLEAGLGNHAGGSWVVAEVADGEIGETVSGKGILYQRAHGLGGVAHTPIGLADPIAELGVIPAE